MALFVDPPEGWKFGFPKEVPVGEKPSHQWLIDNGYPAEKIDEMGGNMILRCWESEEGCDLPLGEITEVPHISKDNT